MDPGYRYGGEALFFVGIAMRLIPWLIRTSREVQQGDGQTAESGLSFFRPAVKQTSLVSATLSSPAITPEQQARIISMITESAATTAGQTVEHRCPKCGTLIHADVVHGGFGPCRKCGWSASPPSSSS